MILTNRKGWIHLPISNQKKSVKSTPLKTTKPKEEITSLLEIKVKYKCSACGKEYERQKGNFPASQSPLYKFNNAFLHTCNHCVDKMFERYSEKLNDDEEAMRRVFSKCDIYFEPSCFAASAKKGVSNSRIKSYISKLNLGQYSQKTYDDTLDEEKTETIDSFEDIGEFKDSKNIEKAAKIWGFGFSVQQYEFLNSQFSDWKARVVIDGKARESLVRELCIIKTLQNKSLQDGDIDLYDKLTKTYQSTMASANLKPIQEDANDKASEKPMGVMIDMFENDDPIPAPLDCWKDVDGIIKLFTVYFLGHLLKMVGVKNRYSKMYEEEMQKYRVEIEDLSDSDDEDVFEYLVNNGVPKSDGDDNGN